MNKKYAVFTMDVEAFTDTECVCYSGDTVKEDLLDGFDEYIKLLDKYNIKSTLFTVGKLVPKIQEKLKRCVQNGHRVALHSLDHVAPMKKTVPQFRAETRRAKKLMDQTLGTEVTGFRAPNFSMDAARLDVLRELGFSYDSSHLNFPARHTVELDLSDYETVRKNMFRKDGFYEFGMSQSTIFGRRYPISGGGYVRLGHWGYIRSKIYNYARKNDYYVFYLHPFEMTRQKVPTVKGLKSYDRYYLKRGVRNYGAKVEQIIRILQKQGFEFVTYEDLVSILQKQGASV